MSSLNLSSFAPLFGLPPSSSEIKAFLSTLTPPSSSSSSLSNGKSSLDLVPEIKTYPDAVYHNYYAFGLSLFFDPTKNNGLESVDIFNPSPFPKPPKPGRKPEPTYAAPPRLTMDFPTDTLVLPPLKQGGETKSISRPRIFSLDAETTGRQFVSCLGEPSRKGSGGWTGVWLEWSPVELVSTASSQPFPKDTGVESETVKVGIMLELRDPGAQEKVSDDAKKKGMGGVWERAAGWSWASVKVFKP
ncbi:hypothetical protein I316_06022 [Kwoniella heveanensis BCC8398]|uniref:Uncharacterized protein n=1 Tax=Kwoniella heveanensis BCC8398 TaxID=1296120 RepID=A0A1B9GN01_9TREE|nr:hypothetical protein I316_06022 [Kwoniella heveanensis BCC8398]